MRTGKVAIEAGVNVQTLRYYERRGILSKPRRKENGYREYQQDAVRLIRFVKRTQELGFTLDEIEDLLRLRNERRASCGEVKAAAEVKTKQIDEKIRALKAMRRALSTLVASCSRNERERTCPLLESLEAAERRVQSS